MIYLQRCRLPFLTVFNKFDKSNPQSILNQCPAFNSNLKNLFAIRSLYDFEFKIDGENVTSQSNTPLGQRLMVRSLNNRFFSFYI